MNDPEADEAGPLPALPSRPADGHKGTFGTVLVIGGCATPTRRMLGAPALTASGALRTGTGLAQIMCPRPIVDHVLTLCPSATGWALPVEPDGSIVAHEAAELFDEAVQKASVIAIGPGLGDADGVIPLVLRAVGQAETPVVADADALNALADLRDVAKDVRAPLIVTPHPGEYRRLAKNLGITADPLADRNRAAEALAQRLGCIAVLKGSGTVVSDGQRTWTCAHGHPCLGTAGTGDVLTGIVAGLVAQYVPDGPAAIGSVVLPRRPDRPLSLFDAARLAVEIHAHAGERWARERHAGGGMLASELVDFVPSEVEARRLPVA
ncbi:MAG: NAD(P)H-hydrate dehydratase [Planctomycetota bacterium]